MNLEQIYLLYYGKMKRYAREYVSYDEDAENILQDVFADYWEKRPSVTAEHAEPFLYAAVRNRCIDFLRRRIVERQALEYLQQEHIAASRDHSDSFSAFDDFLQTHASLEEMLHEAIASLPEKCRLIFRMHKIEGKSQRAVAAELRISPNTVETQMGIAYRKLRARLKDCYPLLPLLAFF
jgi:RNA polymerase sigma-70 factor (ECF subfamily)